MNNDNEALPVLTEEEKILVKAWREIPERKKDIIAVLLSEYGIYTQERHEDLKRENERAIEEYRESKEKELSEKWNRAGSILNNIGKLGMRAIFNTCWYTMTEKGNVWKDQQAENWRKQEKEKYKRRREISNKREFIENVFQNVRVEEKQRILDFMYLIAGDADYWDSKRKYTEYCSIGANQNKKTAYRDAMENRNRITSAAGIPVTLLMQ